MGKGKTPFETEPKEPSTALSGAIESTAATVPEIIQEMMLTRMSERENRLIDKDEEGSMERKKREGYF